MPGGSDGKASVYNAGDPGSIPGLEDPLEKKMATYFHILAWKTPWTEEPGRIQSIGSQKSQTRLSSSSRLPWWLSSKESACNAENLSLVPGLGRSPGGGHGNPLQYSCLENPMDRGAWQAVVHWVSQSWTQLKQLSSISSRVLS